MAKKPKDRNYLALRDSNENLDFGRLIADHDDDLAQYYVAAERYVKRALNVEDPAVFFVGPKGIGKSAILQMVRLTKSSEDNRIINITPDDLAFSALANAEGASSILHEAGKNQWLFKALWDYILLLEIFRREFASAGALAGFVSGLFQGQYEKEARRLVALSEDKGSETLTSRILQLIHEIEVSGEYAGGRVGATVKLEKSRESSVNSFQLLNLVNSLAKKMRDNVRHPYYVLIDDLDLYWEDKPTQNSFIAGLFTSLRHFSHPPIKAVVALRDNIFDALPLIDRDKFPDVVCHVRWDYAAVRQMLEQRVVFRLKVQPTEVWGGVFPENASDLIWMHSNGRPREAIRLATIAANEALHNGHLQILPEDMDKAIRDFSNERIREVTDEYRYKYPGLEFLVRRMNGWPREFPYDRVTTLLDLVVLEIEMKEPGSERYDWIAGFANDPRRFAELLLQHNILWIKLSRTDTAKPYDSKNSVEVTSERWFAVHPMFAPGLGLIGV